MTQRVDLSALDALAEAATAGGNEALVFLAALHAAYPALKAEIEALRGAVESARDALAYADEQATQMLHGYFDTNLNHEDFRARIGQVADAVQERAAAAHADLTAALGATS